ncbi:MAG: peroxide stress protein YaaA [Solobacterium sp.]|nr:peroxide stress protein YaaA [Solobacterium sp.]
MARGAMVRWMAEHSIEDVQDLQAFRLLDYTYSPACSTSTEYVFIRKKESRNEE